MNESAQHHPQTVDEFQQALQSLRTAKIFGNSGEGNLSTLGYQGVLEYRPNDLVVKVKSGTLMPDLLAEIEGQSLTLPVAGDRYGLLSHSVGTVGGWIGRGLPHLNEGRYGGVRDWVTGMTVLLANGDVVRMGSDVVKSVSGYDMHRMMVGSRGQLGLILDVTLRLRAMKSVEEPDVFWNGDTFFGWVSRLPRDGFESVANEIRGLVAADCESGLVWTHERPRHERVVWSMSVGGDIWPQPSPGVAAVRRRLKERLDPEGKFV